MEQGRPHRDRRRGQHRRRARPPECRRHRAGGRAGDPGHGERAFARLPASHGRARRAHGLAGGQLLDLARGDVFVSEAARARSRERNRIPALLRDAEERLHRGGRVPLSAQRAGRKALRKSRRDGRAASARRAAHRHRDYPAAFSLRLREFRRGTPYAGAEALRDDALGGSWNGLGAEKTDRRQPGHALRRRAAQPARGKPGHAEGPRRRSRRGRP